MAQRVKPTSAGSKSSTLRITSNDPDTPAIDIPLTGAVPFSVKINDIHLRPASGTVESGEFILGAIWPPTLDRNTFAATLNEQDITSIFTLEATDAIATINPIPGEKLFVVTLRNNFNVPSTGSSIFTVTSTLARENFPGGLLVFQCSESFLNSPIQIPGFNVDSICSLMPVAGVFPSGSSTFPYTVSLPILFGIFPAYPTFNYDSTVSNGISVSPVNIGINLLDPTVPGNEGKVCYFGAAMHGVILPSGVSTPGGYKAVMVQRLNSITISTVQGGQCLPIFLSPSSVDLITFNYYAS
jgi:hypothetical protein